MANAAARKAQRAASGTSELLARLQQMRLSCRRRYEPVVPLEKNGFYPQAEGWCAQQYAFDRGRCKAGGNL